MGMSQFEAALCLTLELIKHPTILNHQVGNKFQRDIALQFFVPRKPDNPHSASPEDLDQRVAAKDSLPIGELTRRRFRDAARVLISHIEKITIIEMERKVKAGVEPPLLALCCGSLGDLCCLSEIVYTTLQGLVSTGSLSARSTSIQIFDRYPNFNKWSVLISNENQNGCKSRVRKRLTHKTGKCKRRGDPDSNFLSAVKCRTLAG